MRRFLACLVALLVLLEGAGVARALSGAAESIECCCGRHDVRRACKCKACPVSKRGVGTTRFDQPRECDGHDQAGVLVVTALLDEPPAALALVSMELAEAPLLALVDRLVEVGRPPP